MLHATVRGARDAHDRRREPRSPDPSVPSEPDTAAFTTGVRRITVTFVDHSRRTPANPPAHVQAAKSRTLAHRRSGSRRAAARSRSSSTRTATATRARAVPGSSSRGRPRGTSWRRPTSRSSSARRRQRRRRRRRQPARRPAVRDHRVCSRCSKTGRAAREGRHAPRRGRRSLARRGDNARVRRAVVLSRPTRRRRDLDLGYPAHRRHRLQGRRAAAAADPRRPRPDGELRGELELVRATRPLRSIC